MSHTPTSRVSRESPLTQLLRRYGVTPALSNAATVALSQRARVNPDPRRDIILAGLLAAGAYVILSLAGAGSHPYLALLLGAGLALLVRWRDRSGHAAIKSDCEALMNLTRRQIDFQALARDIYAADPALAEDLRAVLVVGATNPADLSDYSILHLWECVRVRAAECDQHPALPG